MFYNACKFEPDRRNKMILNCNRVGIPLAKFAKKMKLETWPNLCHLKGVDKTNSKPLSE